MTKTGDVEIKALILLAGGAIGLGAGAVAEAEISNGQVGAINVINGGRGYTPSPANPTVPALISISTGAIVDIIVR